MMNNPEQAALGRYNEHFEAETYERIAGLLASNLSAERDDPRVTAALNLLIDLCLEVCGSAPHEGSWHRFAAFCGQNGILKYTVDAVVSYLQRFAEDNLRIDDFEATAKALLLAYSAKSDASQAAAHANGIHSWQGRAGYDLLASADYLTQAAIQLLVQGDAPYIREKLQTGLERLTSALYEGIRSSDQPERFNFKSIYFPNELDT
ncbi:MAG: hypothetical protein ABI700_01070 [Chloroflexota bacterium]